MFCKECGKQIDNDSKFCMYCGRSLNSDITSHDEIPPFDTCRKQPKQTQAGTAFLIIVFVINAIGCGVCSFLLNDRIQAFVKSVYELESKLLGVESAMVNLGGMRLHEASVLANSIAVEISIGVVCAFLFSFGVTAIFVLFAFFGKRSAHFES